MKVIKSTTINLNQRELFVSTTTVQMETMTKNLSGIGAMSRTQVMVNGLMELILPQQENTDATLTFRLMKPQENSVFYY